MHIKHHRFIMKKFCTFNSNTESVLTEEQSQSATIDLLRFPLAIMVIFIHMSPSVVSPLVADFNLLSWQGIYNVLGVVLSHVLTGIAVPTFFMISGFLFFVNFRQWSWDGYKNKIRSRVKTLLIPYIMWNAMALISVLLCVTGGVLLKGKPSYGIVYFLRENAWHAFYDIHEWDTTRVNWLGIGLRMTGPCDLPLWFLRDLIIVTLLSPVVYYSVKRLGRVIVLLLFLAYISRIWPLVQGISVTAVFYFTTGAYFAVNGLNIIEFASKYRRLLLPMYALMLVLTTMYDGMNTLVGQKLYPICICLGVFTAFHVASQAVIRYNMRASRLLVSSCFFIYAFHGLSIPIVGSPLYAVRAVLSRLIPGDCVMERIAIYLVTPFVTAALCIVVLIVLRKLFPKKVMLLSGNK